jgi:hypothetical protein
MAAVGVVAAAGPLRARLERRLADPGPDGVVPAAPEGLVRSETVRSRFRSRDVGLWTAVPHGHGTGAGLPVCAVLHGASATTADFGRFGFARFLTAAVAAGAEPFVLAGLDGGRSYWRGDGAADDPQAMLREELPRWCRERGFDPSRLAAYGWSMGGVGALSLLLGPQAAPVRAVAALSPALVADDPVVLRSAELPGSRIGLWCGRSDAFLPEVRRVSGSVRGGPAVAAFDLGGHTREYWNRVTPAAFAFVGRALAGAPEAAPAR